MLSLLLGLSLSHAAGLPSVDDALRTGATAPADTAVVIGIEDYAFVADVPYAQRDAATFYDFLVYTRGVPASRVRLLDQGASREQILEAVTTAGSEVGAGGTVWVYFAGHGAADPSTGGRMLLGDDVKQDPTAFASRGVPVTEVKRLASENGGALNLVVDSCYSGLGRDGAELVAGKRFLVPAYASASPAGDLEWSAASGDQLSGPLHPVRHGAFTYLAIGALRGWADGQIDGKRDGQVTAEEAHLYVQSSLRALQVTDQTPELSVSDASGRVLIKADKLEEAPELNAKMAVGGAPASGPTLTAKPTGVIDAQDRPLVESYVRSAVTECVAQHGGGDPLFNRWSVRFKVKTGGKLKGYMASLGQYSESPAVYPTLSCVRDQVKSWQFSAVRTVTFHTAITLETTAPPPAPAQPVATPQPAPVQSAQPQATQPTTTDTTYQLPGLTVTVNEGAMLPTEISTTAVTTTAPATVPASAPAPQPANHVTMVVRSQDGEWVDIHVDGRVVAELRTDDEEQAVISPGVHTVEFYEFMAEEPYARGRLDTTGQAEIVFGVRKTGIELYGAGSWTAQ